MRGLHRHHVQQQTRTLPAGKVGDGGLDLLVGDAPLGQAGPAAALAGLRQGAADDFQGRIAGIHRLDLMLVKPADLEAAITAHVARLGLQGAGHQLGEGGFASAVDAENADTVIQIKPQVQVSQDRLARLIARGHAFEADQGRRQRARGRGQDEGGGMFARHGGDRGELGQHLQAGLSLGGLGCGGAEAVDEGLQVGALGVDLHPGGFLQARALLPLMFEIIVVARIEVQLAVDEVEDVIDGIVEDFAVVADDDGGVGVAL